MNTNTISDAQRLYKIGIKVFLNDEDVKLKFYINERFDQILKLLNNQQDDIAQSWECSVAVDGVNSKIYLMKDSFLRLSNLPESQSIDNSIIDLVIHIINKYIYSILGTPEIIVFNYFTTHSMIQKMNDNRDSNSNKRKFEYNNPLSALSELKLRCAKIALFPIIVNNTFILVVLLVRKAKAYILSCNDMLGNSLLRSESKVNYILTL